MNFIAAITVGALVLLLHTFLLYPLSLRIAGTLFPSKKRTLSGGGGGDDGGLEHSDDLPTVTLVIAAYNEEEVLEEKIANCRELLYPAGQMELLIGSDGSTDGTAAVLSRHPEIKSFLFDENRGKAAVLNDLIGYASGEILVFSDANTMLQPDAVAALSREFRDPEAGVVSGRLVLRSSGDASLSHNEGFYWRTETELKRLESRWGATMGANGALYALRREWAAVLPTDRTVMDDFWMTAEVLKRGKKSLLAPEAIGVENTSSEKTGEFRRKIRIGRANFNYLSRFLPLLRPDRPAVAYAFFSHKLLRWFAPLLMLVVLSGAVVGSTAPGVTFSSLLLIAQAIFYTAALLGWSADRRGIRSPLTQIPFYFVSMNLALLIGLFQSFRPTQGGGWERVARQQKGEE